MNIEPHQLCEVVACDPPQTGNIYARLGAIYFAMFIQKAAGSVVRTIEPCDIETVIRGIATKNGFGTGAEDAALGAKALGQWWHIVDDTTGADGYRPECCLRPLPPLEFTLHRAEEIEA